MSQRDMRPALQRDGQQATEPDAAYATSTPQKRAADGMAADVAVRRMANAPASGPVRVLVTGYGAFDGIQNNPTAAIAEKLGQVKIPGAIVKAVVLPVTWKDVDAFIAGELKQFHADIVIG